MQQYIQHIKKTIGHLWKPSARPKLLTEKNENRPEHKLGIKFVNIQEIKNSIN